MPVLEEADASGASDWPLLLFFLPPPTAELILKNDCFCFNCSDRAQDSDGLSFDRELGSIVVDDQ